MGTFSALLDLCAGNSPVTGEFPAQSQWRGLLICTWIHGWVNNREAGDLRRRGAHYDITVMHMVLARHVQKMNTVDSRYLAPVGSQNSRARVKWFSRYLALSRERPRLANSGSLSNSMLSDNRGTYVSRISTHIDTPATNHNKQH